MSDLNPDIIEKVLKVLFDAGMLEPESVDYYIGSSDQNAHKVIETVLSAAADDLRAEGATEMLRELELAVAVVNGRHHFHDVTCSCGFEGDARKRTQTEHITAAVLEEYDND